LKPPWKILIIGVYAARTGSGSIVGGRTPDVTASRSILVSPDLFVQLVNKAINRSVHVTVNILGKQGFAGSVDCCFSLLLVVFNFKNDIGRNHVIEMDQLSYTRFPPLPSTPIINKTLGSGGLSFVQAASFVG
jgi:hypothetical protein